jgi:hypothetical protein
MDEKFIGFVQKACSLGICDSFSTRVEQAGSKKQFLDLALNSAATPWVAERISQGLVCSAREIARMFSSLSNGRYISRQDGYSGMLFTENADITITEANNLVLSSGGKIEATRPCDIYIVDSVVEIKNTCPVPASVSVYLYNSSIKTEGDSSIKVKREYHHEQRV